MDATRIKPLGDRVLVKEKKAEQTTASGIIIPDSVRNDLAKYGEVISVGPGIFTQNGVLIPMTVKVGDTVLMPAYETSGTTVKFDGVEYTLIREAELLMVA